MSDGLFDGGAKSHASAEVLAHEEVPAEVQDAVAPSPLPAGVSAAQAEGPDEVHADVVASLPMQAKASVDLASAQAEVPAEVQVEAIAPSLLPARLMSEVPAEVQVSAARSEGPEDEVHADGIASPRLPAEASVAQCSPQADVPAEVPAEASGPRLLPPEATVPAEVPAKASGGAPSVSETARAVSLFESFVRRCVEVEEQAAANAVSVVPYEAPPEQLQSLSLKNAELRRGVFRLRAQCDSQQKAQEELTRLSQLAGARVGELDAAIRACELGLAGGSGSSHKDAAEGKGKAEAPVQRLNFGLKLEPIDEPQPMPQSQPIKAPAVKAKKKKKRPLPPTVTVTSPLDIEPRQEDEDPVDASSAAEIFGQWLRLTHEALSDLMVKSYVAAVRKHEAMGWRRAPDGEKEKAALQHFATFRKMGLQSNSPEESETACTVSAPPAVAAPGPTADKRRRVAPASMPLNSSLWVAGRSGDTAGLSEMPYKRPSGAG